MRRPTPEQSAEHESAWKSYQATSGDEVPLIQSLSAGNPSMAAAFREQFIVACFLEDVLLELGAPPPFRKEALFKFGRLCFGRPVWQAFDEFLPKLEVEIKRFTAKSEWADVPVEQKVPGPTMLLTQWWENAKRFRGDRGVYPHVFLARSHDDSVDVHALAIKSESARNHALLEIQTKGPVEFVFGLDMTSVPGQGLEFADFLTVVWYLDGQFYTGIVDYQVSTATPPPGEEEPAFRPIRWDNNYWNHSLREKDPIPAMTKALEAANTSRGDA